MTRYRYALLYLSLLLTVVAAIEGGFAQSSGPTFVDVTKEAGIDFLHSFGDQEMDTILEATGSGCAFLDYDGDGDLDLYVVNGAHLPEIQGPYPEGHEAQQEPYNHLYRNDGDGTFTDVTQEAGVGDRGYGAGVAAGDYDNDGDSDLFIANYGPNVLYRNDGDGTFTEVAQMAGVTGPETLNGFPKWSLHGCFFDYDKDGWLDLYVANYLAFDPEYRYYFSPENFPGPLSYEGQPDILYHNNGDGTFTDVTQQAGVFNPQGRGMSVGAADYDNDGDPDVFVANDAMENYLYRNDGDGTFTEVGLLQGVGFGEFGEATSSMGPAFADYDNDADLDLFVPDMGYSCLYRNDGDMFQEVSAVAGIAEVSGQYTSWAPITFDYDNDGYRDIFVTNGDAHHQYTEEDLLFRNRGDMTFEDVSLASGDYFRKAEYVGRGATFGDYDNDGDLDVFVNNLGGPAILLRNEGGNRNHWLSVRTVGTRSNRGGVGARIRIVAGSLQGIGEVVAGAGYLSSPDPRVHFGLGDRAQVELLEVRWPSGVVQQLRDVAADQILIVTEPQR